MTILLNSLAILGTQELIIIGLIILIFFGGAKIPSLMRGLGRGMGEFKKGIEEGKRSFEEIGNDDEPSTKAN